MGLLAPGVASGAPHAYVLSLVVVRTAGQFCVAVELQWLQFTKLNEQFGMPLSWLGQLPMVELAGMGNLQGQSLPMVVPLDGKVVFFHVELPWNICFFVVRAR